jgi:predicted ABC-type ATPase
MKNRTVYIIAGPNGAGKTTFALRFLPDIAGCRNFINADLIARGIAPLNVDSAAMEAGKMFLKRIDEQINKNNDFAFETTLSGLSYVNLCRQLQRKKYKIHIYFLWIPSVELALKRIADRVRLGGHDIPHETVKRRYYKGLSNFFNRYMGLADYCAVFDNSSSVPVLIYEKNLRKRTCH